jgi:hypothetical protein
MILIPVVWSADRGDFGQELPAPARGARPIHASSRFTPFTQWRCRSPNDRARPVSSFNGYWSWNPRSEAGSSARSALSLRSQTNSIAGSGNSGALIKNGGRSGASSDKSSSGHYVKLYIVTPMYRSELCAVRPRRGPVPEVFAEIPRGRPSRSWT